MTNKPMPKIRPPKHQVINESECYHYWQYKEFMHAYDADVNLIKIEFWHCYLCFTQMSRFIDKHGKIYKHTTRPLLESEIPIQFKWFETESYDPD